MRREEGNADETGVRRYGCRMGSGGRRTRWSHRTRPIRRPRVLAFDSPALPLPAPTERRSRSARVHNTLYVVDFERGDVQKFRPDGTFLAKLTGPGSSGGRFVDLARIGVDARGNLYVPDATHTYIIAPDGMPLLTLGGGEAAGGQLGKAIDAVADGAGNVFVSDAVNNRISVFDGTGRFLTSWGGAG